MTPQPSPPENEELKTLLRNSFHSEPSDEIPPLPDDLRERIRDQYGRQAASPPDKPRESLLNSLWDLFRRPAFAGAAAAVLLLGVALLVFFPKDGATGDGAMRGAGSGDGQAITIMLYKAPAEVKEALLKRGFDESRIRTVTDPSAATSSEGPVILVDGADAELEYHPGDGKPSVITKFPADPDAVATEVLKLAAPPRQE